MGPKAPANLVLTKAHLTDKPYEAQVAVLRWVKQLVGNLVDSAVCHGRDGTIGADCSKEDSAMDMATLSEDQDLSECGKDESSARGLHDTRASHEQHVCTDHLSTGLETGTGTSQTALASSSEYKRRKRPRTSSLLGKNRVDVGTVVECYYTVRLFFVCLVEVFTGTPNLEVICFETP